MATRGKEEFIALGVGTLPIYNSQYSMLLLYAATIRWHSMSGVDAAGTQSRSLCRSQEFKMSMSGVNLFLSGCEPMLTYDSPV